MSRAGGNRETAYSEMIRAGGNRETAYTALLDKYYSTAHRYACRIFYWWYVTVHEPGGGSRSSRLIPDVLFLFTGNR
jgi:adenylate cyclase